MARYEYRERVAAESVPDCAGGCGSADAGGEGCVGAGLAPRNALAGAPDSMLEWRSVGRIEGYFGEVGGGGVKVGIEEC
jgi:hypothetical protein